MSDLQCGILHSASVGTAVRIDQRDVCCSSDHRHVMERADRREAAHGKHSACCPARGLRSCRGILLMNVCQAVHAVCFIAGKSVSGGRLKAEHRARATSQELK